LPGARAFKSFVAAGDFAADYRGAQLTFGQIIGAIDAVTIQKGKEMITLLVGNGEEGLGMVKRDRSYKGGREGAQCF